MTTRMNWKRARRLTASTLLAVGLALSAAPAGASEIGNTRRFGLGVMIGSPSGISAKLYLSPRHALDFGLGIGFLGGPGGSFHMDYLFHFMLTEKPGFDLPLYIGIGGEVLFFWNDNYNRYYYGPGYYPNAGRVGVGVRVPIGIAFQLNRAPVDIFIEAAPGVGLFPYPGFYVEGAVGARYWF